MEPTSLLRDCLGDLLDPRIDRTKLHDLLDIIGLTLVATVCGAESWTDIAAFGQAKLGFLQTFLHLPNGIPSHDTLGRVFVALDPVAFGDGFHRWVDGLHERVNARIVLDGKTLRRSHDRPKGQAPLHLVSAWANDERLVLAQVPVTNRTNEITVLPEVIASLNVKGSVVTIDAMGCQTTIAQQIVAQGGDYVLALKLNQPALHAGVVDAFRLAAADGFTGVAHDWDEATQKGHGRLETRRITTITEPSWVAYLNPDGAWAGLRTLIHIHSRREVLGAAASEADRYYISSVNASAQELSKLVRGHWGIENSEHWVLDMAFREDENRVRQGDSARNFATVRRLALNLLQQETTTKLGVKAKRLKAGWDHTYLLKVVFRI